MIAMSVGDAFLSELATKIAPMVASLVAAQVLDGLRQTAGLGSPRYATAKENPLRSPKAFRAAYRGGAFPTFLQGREKAAMWIDVETWMRTRQKPVPVVVVDEAVIATEMELAQAFGPSRRRKRAA